MKEHKNNKHLYKILNAQQLGLKLISNVTYGYTSANFSGRMPCIEVIFRNYYFLLIINLYVFRLVTVLSVKGAKHWKEQ